MIDNRFAFGLVGDRGALAGADFLQHLIRATAVDPERYAVAFEHQSFPGDRLRADTGYDPTGRKLHALAAACVRHAQAARALATFRGQATALPTPKVGHRC